MFTFVLFSFFFFFLGPSSSCVNDMTAYRIGWWKRMPLKTRKKEWKQTKTIQGDSWIHRNIFRACTEPQALPKKWWIFLLNWEKNCRLEVDWSCAPTDSHPVHVFQHYWIFVCIRKLTPPLNHEIKRWKHVTIKI